MAKKKKILVVEDHEDALNLMIEALEQHYEVDGAANLEKALMLVEAKTYHVALVDIMLAGPGDRTNRDGLIVLQRLKELNEGNQRVVLSGQDEPQLSADTLQEYGCFRYLDKVMTREQGLAVLYDTVSAALKACKISPYGHRKERDRVVDVDVLTFLAGGPDKERFWVPGCLETLCPKGGYTGLKRFFEAFCEPLTPLMPQVESSEPTIIDQTNKWVTGRFWSKGFGCPVVIVVSPVGQKLELASGKITPEWSESTEIWRYEKANLVGFAFRLEKVVRSQFVQKLF